MVSNAARKALFAWALADRISSVISTWPGTIAAPFGKTSILPIVATKCWFSSRAISLAKPFIA